MAIYTLKEFQFPREHILHGWQNIFVSNKWLQQFPFSIVYDLKKHLKSVNRYPKLLSSVNINNRLHSLITIYQCFELQSVADFQFESTCLNDKYVSSGFESLCFLLNSGIIISFMNPVLHCNRVILNPKNNAFRLELH